MPAPYIKLSEREVLIRGSQTPGRYCAIQIQAERGLTTPQLVQNVTRFFEDYTWNGVIPEQASNRSGYHAAADILRNTDRLWVVRVIPAGALHAGALFVQENTPETIDLDTQVAAAHPVHNAEEYILQPDTFGFDTGDCVTIVGEDLPVGVTNGGIYFLARVASGANYQITLFDTEANALAFVDSDGATTTGRVEIGGPNAGDGGTGNLHMYRTEKLVVDGISDPDSYAVIGDNAFLIYDPSPGAVGNNIKITVEVPREAETGIAIVDEVDAELGDLPVTVGFWGASSAYFGTPVMMVPLSEDTVLPTLSDATPVAFGDFFYVLSDRTDRIKLATALDDALNSTYVTFDGSGDVGSGEVRIVPFATTVFIDGATGVNYDNNQITTRDLGDNVNVTVKTLTKCLFYGDTLPSPLEIGTEYYLFRTGGSGELCKIASSYANAVSGVEISLSNLITPSNFYAVCYPNDEEDLVIGTVVVDLEENATFDPAADVDEGNDTIDVGAGNVFPDNTRISFSGSGGAFTIDGSDPIGATTDYFVVNGDNDLGTFQVETSIGGGAVALVAGTGSVTVSVNYIEEVDQDTGITAATDRISLASSYFKAGMRVRVASDDVLPTGLAAGTDYWLTNRAGASSPWTFQLLDDFDGELVPISDTGGAGATMTVTVQDPVVDPNYISVGQQFRTGTPVQLTGTPPLVAGDALNTDDTYYIVDATSVSNPELFRCQLARTKEAAYSGVVIDFDGNSDETDTFSIIPLAVTSEDVNLSGAIDYSADTIKLNLHSGSYQEWAPGEAIRVSPVSGSTLPYGLSASATYYVLPVGDGKIKLCRLNGNVLDDVSSLAVVNLSSDTGKKGSGTMTLAPVGEPLQADTFRVKVWRTAYRRSQAASSEISLLESHVVSLMENLQDGNGRNLFIESRLEASSRYVRAVSMATEGLSMSVKAVPFLQALGGGLNDDTEANDGTITSSDLVTSLDQLTDPIAYPISYIVDGGYTFPSYQVALVTFAETRKCMALLSTPQEAEDASDPVRYMIDYKNDNLPGSSFYMIFTPWQVATDPGLGRDILVPPVGSVAARMSSVDYQIGPHIAVAGINYGRVNTRGGQVVFSQAQLDDLANNKINPIISIPGYGPTIWGNDTGLGYESPYSRAHVRRLMNQVFADMGELLKPFIYSPINARTFSRINSVCSSYLKAWQGKGAFTDSKVVCNETNNTAEDANNETINVWGFVQPVNVAKFINFTAIVTPAGVEFSSTDLDL